ncbi:MAG: type II secretion system protein [bacterium]|nr:type II secretion system protein [bacterium]
MTKQVKGFTLIELLVTISIIGILSSLTIYGVKAVRSRARDTERITHLNRIQGALTLYYAVEKQYPDTLNPLEPSYLKNIPTDPVTHTPYSYGTDITDNFAIWGKMEIKNDKAINDNGNCDNYYETGNGDSWSVSSISTTTDPSCTPS